MHCEVVLGDRVAEVALWRVRDDQQTPAVLLLDGHQLHHEDAGNITHTDSRPSRKGHSNIRMPTVNTLATPGQGKGTEKVLG